MDARHWRAKQLCVQRDVLRLVALVAFYLLVAYASPAIQFMAGFVCVIAVICQFRAGTAARKIDAAATMLCFETDPGRESEARDRLDSLIIRSRWHDRL